MAEARVDFVRTRLSYLGAALPSGRQHRGVIDGIDQASRFLFGTATDHDVQVLNEQVRKLEQAERTIVHSVEEQLTYINRNAAVEKRHDDMIGRLSTGVSVLINALQDQANENQNTTTQIVHTVQMVSALQTTWFQLDANIDHIEQEVSRYEEVVLAAEKGYLHPKHISPTEFLSLLRGITERLPNGYTLLHTLSPSSVPKLLASAFVILQRISSGFHFFVQISILPQDCMFNLFDVVTLPQQPEAGRSAVRVIPDVGILGVSTNQ
jgi:hypothetical protein